MANQSSDRKYKSIRGKVRRMGIAATEQFYQGSSVFRNATGYMTRPVATSGFTDVAMGVCRETVDNSAGGDADLNVYFETGAYQFANSSGDPVDITHVGALVYAEDDQTVAATDATSTLPTLGTLVFIEGTEIYVQVGPVAQED